MWIKNRFDEFGPVVSTFFIYQLLAFVVMAATAFLMSFLTVIASLVALESSDAAYLALDTLLEAILAGINAGAIAYGLRLLYLRHRSTRNFWTIYLTLSIVLYAFYALRGDSGCFSVVPMVINLGWLYVWDSNVRARELFP